jgi:predicted amidophosphoribosyltransferase
MAVRRCRECGAHLTKEGASCPLCGENGSAVVSPQVVDVTSYQTTVQELREQLRRLRRDAKAV